MLSNRQNAMERKNQSGACERVSNRLNNHYFGSAVTSVQSGIRRQVKLRIISNEKKSEHRKGISLSLSKRKGFVQLYQDRVFERAKPSINTLKHIQYNVAFPTHNDLYYQRQQFFNIDPYQLPNKGSHLFNNTNTTTCQSIRNREDSIITLQSSAKQESITQSLIRNLSGHVVMTHSLHIESGPKQPDLQKRRRQPIFKEKQSTMSIKQFPGPRKIRSLQEAPLYYSIVIDEGDKQLRK